MLSIMLIAHLLGDYLFQFNVIARWKARSIWGVVAHGGIVTLTTLVCAVLADPAWWPYALVIGAIHTVIDIVRAQIIVTKSTREDLLWYLLDQAVHVLVIVLMVWLSHGQGPRPRVFVGRGLSASKMTAFLIGYLLLLQPSWVLLRFIVRGIWGAEAAPHLGGGEKYPPMIERVLITSLVLIGQVYLVPLVLLPRRLNSVRIQGNGVGILVQLTGHWAETFLSVLLAVSVGLVLRIMVIAG